MSDRQETPGDGQAEGRVFANVFQAYKHLTGEAGFQASYNTVKKHLVDENPPRAPRRRGGGWTAGALATYAAAHLPRKVDPSQDADRPVKPKKAAGTSGDQPGAAEMKTLETVQRIRVQRKKDELDLAERQGLLVETATMERELAERAKAFRLALLGYVPRLVEDLAAHFGAGRSAALELCRRLGSGEDKAPLVQDWAQELAKEFGRAWAGKVEDFLDPFSSDAWWTESMRQAWAKLHGGAAGDLAKDAPAEDEPAGEEAAS